MVFFHEPQKLGTLVVAALQTFQKEAAEARRGAGGEAGASVTLLGSGALAAGTGVVAANSGGIAAGGNVTIVQGPHPAGPDEASIRAAYLWRLIDKTGFLILRRVDPSVAEGSQDPRLRLQGVSTALRTLSYDGESGRGAKSPFAQGESLE